MSHSEHTNQDGHMPHSPSAPPQELFDLLADRALVGLGTAEENRLQQLIKQFPWVRDNYMDEAAAALATSFEASDTTSEPMPADVSERIRLEVAAVAAPESQAPLGRIGTPSPRSSVDPIGWFGWVGWVAAAAAFTVAAVLWEPAVEPVRSAAQLANWAQEHPDAVRWDWAPGLANPAEDVTGYVTFSPEAQEGFMMIKGLEPNDPRVQQYQLWIWDRDREIDPNDPQPLADNVHPVDGGVFDVNADGEVVIPVRAPLRVGQPYLFAVTVERPGGVVKSDKSWVPIIAGPPSDA